MTTNFGCCERRTMASQPSIYNEKRNRLRLQAWEQRNQETSQTKELSHENVPLFKEPYKTNKGDELSNRIQRMLGSYEDVNNPYPFAIDPLPIPTYVTSSQSDQGQPNTNKPTKPPFHNQVHYMATQSQKSPSSNGYSSQPMGTFTTSSPNQHGHSSVFSNVSLNHSQLSFSAHQQKSEAISDLRERGSLPQEMSSQSPDTKPPPFPQYSDHDTSDMDTKDTFDRHQVQGSTDHPSESASTREVSTFNLKQSPKDASLAQANKGNALPSQTFPSLLSSKQPSVVMTQKPTAYVRPMDGQDQMVSESPELKPSPEPYVSLPELINKSDMGKTKILPQFLETRTNEVLCVEDILREMTHSWPPLLTAIHTPNTGEPIKSPFPAKESEHVSSFPEQKNYPKESSPVHPSQLIQQSPSFSFEAAHSRGVESTSSSDSESSSRSESDSESIIEDPPQLPVGNSVKAEPDAPAVSHGDWQLGNWIRPSQQNSGTESRSGVHVSDSPAQKQLPPTQSSKPSFSVEVVDTTRESKPQPSSQLKEFSDKLAKLQQHSESPLDNCTYQSSQKKNSADLNSCSSSRKPSCNTHSSKPAQASFPDCTEATISVKCEEVVATQDKDPLFPDRPKVKTKTGHSKKSKDNSDTKRNSKRTSKHKSLDKGKAGSEPVVTMVLCGHCPSCGVQYPNPCSCPTQSPAQPDQLPPAPPLRISCTKPKLETICQKGTKISNKTTHKHYKNTGQTAKSSRDPYRPPRSLLVKVDLSLLSRVPQTSGNHQEIPSNAKRSAQVIEQDGGGSDASTTKKLSKTSKKSVSQNVEIDHTPLPRKKQRLDSKNASSTHASVKLERSSNSKEDRERNKAKKIPVPLQQPLTPNNAAKGPKVHRHSTGEAQKSSKKAMKSIDTHKHKKSRAKHTEDPQFEKKPPKSSLTIPSSSSSSSSKPTREVLSNRPLVRFEDRHYPVKHYIKEAKKLKHKADAESDKHSKAFNYLDAAMYFVESGIAMEKDPHISMSSYTMFAETVELLKFVLKLKNSVDPCASPSEKDFLALCLKCQSLLQMTMFRHKHKTALKYSKTLTDHFSNSTTLDPPVLTPKVTDTPSYKPNMPSPANTSTSSGPASHHSGSGLVVDTVGSTVAIPQAIGQVAFTYVNITMLFLSAHDIWEQAEELAQKGSGMLAELDTVMGQLRLTSSMTSMVRYTRQGVHWLRMDSQKVK
ncbi:AF4/FMR2 family member 1 isoform X2 [Etheostoma spectabile]|uniref:AF4/FMR2 family member 1 isoform X2 n=1 Tax=Etheostoma spectabile TaxID=54343 RepID=UPI0013AF229A|nr:AF4/FMR2 family member 1-like isoform X2 [Etheostoma spectabile]